MISSSLRKILDRIFMSRYSAILNSSVYSAQHGFKPTKSTLTAITELLNYTTKAIENFENSKKKFRKGLKIVFCVFIDVEKAFDRVPRKAVLKQVRIRIQPMMLVRSLNSY